MSVTAPPVATQPYFASTAPETSFQPSHRKRRAQTPPMSESLPFGNIRLNWLDKQGGVPPPQAPRAKKRRPNLANGLSSLSIQTERPREPEALPSYDESEETRNEVDEDDLLEPNPQSIDDDLEIELMPESSNRPGRSYTMSSSSENSDDESDLFSPMGQHRRHRQRQQPDTVEQPSPVREQMYGFEVEDVTTPELRGQKRREGSPRTERHKRHRSGADIDMDTDNVELRGRKHPRWRKNAHSFEPEKDRIVVTSLSDSESEQSCSRSTSPQREHDYSQPGSQGFTLSPSLLTHLLANQRNTFNLRPEPQERGLVLYRPLGIHPDEVVQQWPGQSDQSIAMHEDSARFEELDDDEDKSMGGMEVDIDEPMQLD